MAYDVCPVLEGYGPLLDDECDLFTEGFDTPDLQAAQALLDALPEHP